MLQYSVEVINQNMLKFSQLSISRRTSNSIPKDSERYTNPAWALQNVYENVFRVKRTITHTFHISKRLK